MFKRCSSNQALSVLLLGTLFALFSVAQLFLAQHADARSAATPWATTNAVQNPYQNLVYGSSTVNDIVQATGEQPDEILHSEQMYPVVENLVYYAEDGSGTATVFVLQNGMLVGMHLRTPDNQLVDLTYFLINNGDMQLNNPLNMGFRNYYFYNQLYQPFNAMCC